MCLYDVSIYLWTECVQYRRTDALWGHGTKPEAAAPGTSCTGIAHTIHPAKRGKIAIQLLSASAGMFELFLCWGLALLRLPASPLWQVCLISDPMGVAQTVQTAGEARTEAKRMFLPNLRAFLSCLAFGGLRLAFAHGPFGHSLGCHGTVRVAHLRQLGESAPVQCPGFLV